MGSTFVPISEAKVRLSELAATVRADEDAPVMGRAAGCASRTRSTVWAPLAVTFLWRPRQDSNLRPRD